MQTERNILEKCNVDEDGDDDLSERSENFFINEQKFFTNDNSSNNNCNLSGSVISGASNNYSEQLECKQGLTVYSSEKSKLPIVEEEETEEYRTKKATENEVTTSEANINYEFLANADTERRVRKIKKSNKVDMKAKLERSRQSARECRARKKLRYQYLEDLVMKREQAVLLLRKEMEMYRDVFKKIDEGTDPQEASKETV